MSIKVTKLELKKIIEEEIQYLKFKNSQEQTSVDDLSKGIVNYLTEELRKDKYSSLPPNKRRDLLTNIVFKLAPIFEMTRTDTKNVAYDIYRKSEDDE